ncbi:MAG: HYExAFE family protein [Planctomycetota bacterium]|nr:HYExAFE family protein [Planctomycetota bacterium]MDA1211647.1 HYExAFE family protein [Planctomycetota bacterium]
MAQRRNHYDAAFEALLRGQKLPYVAVDEARRALLQQASLKSMDFLVYAPGDRQNLLVDVKGRRFPPTRCGAQGAASWENWATTEDITSLLTWQKMFGESFRGVLVFAYELGSVLWTQEFPQIHPFRGRPYAYFGVWVDEYALEMKTRSARWGTVSLSQASFRRLRFPISRVWEGADAADLSVTPAPLSSFTVADRTGVAACRV